VVILGHALCVNLRFIIFSAGWRPYLAHLPFWQRVRMATSPPTSTYAIFLRRFPEPRPASEQRPYFWGGVVTNWSAWQLPSIAGILLADRIPASWGLGFAGTLALARGCCYSLVADRATLVAAPWPAARRSPPMRCR
jgi:predicted branched-subunit amino acid permease